MQINRLTYAAGALALALTAAPPARAALSFTDISLWAGVPSGPGVNEAALVVDWHDGSAPLVWGYRWLASENRTGRDMIAAVLGVDPRLSVQGVSSGFIDGWGLNTDLQGAPERLAFYSGNGTVDFTDDTYWGYWVNNDVYYHPTDFLQNGHIVPPNNAVIPNGNPFAAVNPAQWTESSTGASARPLVNGSWDGWSYGLFGSRPLEPVPAPEPGSGLLCVAGTVLLLRRRRRAAALALLATAGSAAATGPYAPPAGTEGSTAIPAASPLFKAWAGSVAALTRGPQMIGQSGSLLAAYGRDLAAIGRADATFSNFQSEPTVSLGDGGSITLVMEKPVTNGPGADFAVFENGYSASFLELAFVEVSSDGVSFVRFPSVSCTQTSEQINQAASLPAYRGLQAQDLHNLAGKYQVGYGTPFDLDDVKALAPQVNVSRITHVRIVDVVGSIDSALGSRDSLGNLINDPWPTEFYSGGFDLDAVGAIHVFQPPWLAWKAANFSHAEQVDPAISGASADPDRDGTPNAVEYVSGSAPRTPGSSPLTISLSGAAAVLSFRRSPACIDAICELQRAGSGLSGWEPVARSTAGAPMQPLPVSQPPQLAESGTDPVLVTVAVSAAEQSRFYRLAATIE